MPPYKRGLGEGLRGGKGERKAPRGMIRSRRPPFSGSLSFLLDLPPTTTQHCHLSLLIFLRNHQHVLLQVSRVLACSCRAAVCSPRPPPFSPPRADLSFPSVFSLMQFRRSACSLFFLQTTIIENLSDHEFLHRSFVSLLFSPATTSKSSVVSETSRRELDLVSFQSALE